MDCERGMDMNMIASATVIRGKGKCEAFINGIAMKEMKQQNERHAAEMAVVTHSRNRLLADRIEALKPARRESWAHRAKERIVTAWAVLFALLLELKLVEKAG